jgi:hypothetical protein
MRTFLLALVALSGCVAEPAEPAEPRRVIGTPSISIVLPGDPESDVVEAVDAGPGIDGGCYYPPSWPSRAGACLCLQTAVDGCEWDENCDGGTCSTAHPVGALIVPCGVCAP